MCVCLCRRVRFCGLGPTIARDGMCAFLAFHCGPRVLLCASLPKPYSLAPWSGGWVFLSVVATIVRIFGAEWVQIQVCRFIVVVVVAMVDVVKLLPCS